MVQIWKLCSLWIYHSGHYWRNTPMETMKRDNIYSYAYDEDGDGIPLDGTLMMKIR